MSGFAIHLGLIGTAEAPAALQVDGRLLVARFEDSYDETLSEREDVYLAGSWSCWCEADSANASTGPASLHIVQIVKGEDRASVSLEMYVEDLRAQVMRTWHVTGRLLDYAVVTDADDWAEDQVNVVGAGHWS